MNPGNGGEGDVAQRIPQVATDEHCREERIQIEIGIAIEIENSRPRDILVVGKGLDEQSPAHQIDFDPEETNS